MSRTIGTERAPEPTGAYSQGITVDRLMYVSGQVGIDPATGQQVPGGIRGQTRQALQNVGEILRAGGSNLEDIVKTTCFLADISDFADFNDAYAQFFPTEPPARSTIQVGLVPPWLVEIEAVAIRG